MDRKNRRMEFIDKKIDIKKKDRGDLKLPIKPEDIRIKKDRGDLKLPMKPEDIRIKKDRGDLKLPMKPEDIRIKKDRGDLKLPMKPEDIRIKRDQDVSRKIINPDGDKQKVSVNQRPENFKINVIIKQPNTDDTKPKDFDADKLIMNKRNVVKNTQSKVAMDLKRIREKYTVKLRNTNTMFKKDGIDKTKNDLKNSHAEDIKKEIKELPQVYELEKARDCPYVQKETQKDPSQRKKPVIKTIMTKNGSTTIYKAVSFEEKIVKPASLEINIPNDLYKKCNSNKSSDVNSLKSKVTVSKTSVKEKMDGPKKTWRKRNRKYRHLPSRDLSVQDINTSRSPPTEVAKWAPASITTHTKPYYEAWVDTTLTAVSKSDRLNFEKKAFLRYLQKALERPDTPELYYANYADERYTGRIKITHQR